MIFCNRRFLFSVSITLFCCYCFPIADIVAQTPADFQHFHERYPTNPFIHLQNNAAVDIAMDKHGKPVFTIMESDVKMVLTDNFPELSEMRNYYNAKHVVKYIDAYSLVPEDGKFKKIKIPEIKKMTETDNTYYYDDSYCMVGHFPSIKKGSILHNHQKYISPNFDLGFRFFFGNLVPVESANLTLTFPDNIKIVWRYAGNDTSLIKHNVTQKGNLITYSWSCEQLKAYPDENLSTASRYYVPHVIISVAEYNFKGTTSRVMGTIDDLHRWEYNKLKNINTTIQPTIQHLADSITFGINTPREKVKAIYQWVQNKIKYIAIEDGDNGFIPQQAETVLARKYGDCKDKSSLLTALIRAVGEESSFACVGTRRLPYSFSKYPVVSTANHLIAIWWDENKKPVILDGTSQYLGIDEIPSFIQGKECLIVKDSSTFIVYKIPIDAPAKNQTIDTLRLQIQGTNLYGSGVLMAKGDERVELMYELEGKDIKQKTELVSSVLGFAGNKMEISDCTWFSNGNNPIIARYKIALPDYCVASGKLIYVNLNLHQHLSTLDVKSDRTIPVESENTYQNQTTTTLTVPEGYSVVQLPEKSSYSHPKFGFSLTYRIEKNTIVRNTSLSVGFLLLEGEEMSAFREMIQLLKQAYRKTIILERTSP